MEEQDTENYKEPCPQCSDVHWGISDEGKYYCKSCHTVIEKTKEVEDAELFFQNTRIKFVSRGLRKRRSEKGWEWYICEGIQFILLKQAEALQALGLDSQIKDKVMCNLWRRYLQKTKQAYCTKPLTSASQLLTGYESSVASELDSEPDMFRMSQASETDGGTMSDTSCGLPSSGCSTTASESSRSVCSGSVDGELHKTRKKYPDSRMSMPMTLAFCYLSLLWVRASVTLSDLLRLVFNRQIPYFNAEQYFPDRTLLYGSDIRIFEVQSFPVYSDILERSRELGAFLDLPLFPPITKTCFYHPNVLCMKYLMEVNLPDELNNWTYRVAKKAGLDDHTVLTYDPRKKLTIVPYDIRAAALIVVALKLIFALNDDWEWQMSENAQSSNREDKDITVFDFKKWYKTMRPFMDKARSTLEEEYARFSWKSEKILPSSQKVKSRIMKRKRMAKNLQRQFSKLSGAAPDSGNKGPSSFMFNWEEENTGMVCFHGHRLEGIAQEGENLLSGLSTKYWLSSLKKCSSRFCKHWKLYEESKFPRSYDFVLSLFALVLRVEVCAVHHEVSWVEQRLFQEFLTKKPKTKARKLQT
ncbi:TATA box-binding protein-associated factor RNA polymerase I subunit B isoform X2 [Mixophyes fleayi]|uniref:TATA box-binding protein-associated factor RNA polymerase I subunit B isoform X2 n=1 Tax=Mixophyes fleayi TaxID=3061075 RepID=UPI003F4D819D